MYGIEVNEFVTFICNGEETVSDFFSLTESQEKKLALFSQVTPGLPSNHLKVIETEFYFENKCRLENLVRRDILGSKHLTLGYKEAYVDDVYASLFPDGCNLFQIVNPHWDPSSSYTMNMLSFHVIFT